MICFDVYRNGSKLCRAGVVNDVLDSIITWVEHLETLDLHVGGFTHVDGADVPSRFARGK